MASSGTGAKGATKRDKAATAASSPRSRQNGKPYTIGANEALEILESALGYCSKAGLGWTFSNRDGALVLLIAGARYDPAAPEAHIVPVDRASSGTQKGDSRGTTD